VQFSKVIMACGLIVAMAGSSAAQERASRQWRLDKRESEVLTSRLGRRVPGWRVTKSSYAREKNYEQMFVRFDPDGDNTIMSATQPGQKHPSPVVLVEVSTQESSEIASEKFRFGITHTQIYPTGTIPDLGDESVVWSGYGPHGTSSIRFRRDNVFVSVSGPNLNDTYWFAKNVSDDVGQRLGSGGR
jgi:hypothetical protein